MILAFVSGPYRAPTPRGIVENIRAAEVVALELWRLGFAVVCPHLNTALFDGTLPDEAWLAGDLEILSRCDILVTVPGWTNSEGAGSEVAAFDRAKVYHWPESIEALREIGVRLPL